MGKFGSPDRVLPGVDRRAREGRPVWGSGAIRVSSHARRAHGLESVRDSVYGNWTVGGWIVAACRLLTRQVERVRRDERRIRRLGAQSGAKAHARLFSSQATSTSNKAPDLRVIVSGVETGAACRRNATHTNRSCHSVKLDESVLHLADPRQSLRKGRCSRRTESACSNQHRLLGEDTRHRALR
ncbi:DUF736 family protein [Burkholderia anthina]|nr:DUF736 family protein [Burkholderia anthina]